MISRPDIEPVLRAAMALVAADGLKGLSLRPLAERLETTVSALSHRFGLKDALLAALIDAAHAEDRAFLDRWLARIHALGPLDGALMAAVADAILDDMAGPDTLRTLFYCELIQAAPARTDIAAPITAWRTARRDFWRAAAVPLGRPELGDALHGFTTDEAAHSLAIGDLAAYRWLRRLSLRRLCCGLVPARDSSDRREFAVFHAALGDLMDTPGRYTVPPMSAWQKGVARHISALIITGGADAITHRAIAARAGLANSTLAYHFPRQEDLLRAGLHDIIQRTHGIIDASSADGADFDLSSVEVARATFAVALAATRIPSLKAFAADMRRRRGENYLIHLNRQVIGDSRFDLLSAQALAITGIGHLMLDGVLDPVAGQTDQILERLRASAFAP